MRTLSRSLALACAASLVSAIAIAQDSTTKFRVAPDPKNMQSCTAYNFGMTGVHTLVVKGGDVNLSTAGGLNTKMKMVRPNIYETDFQLAGTRVDAVADLGAKTFKVSEKTRGCNWVGVPE
jgi:hypothetical protein